MQPQKQAEKPQAKTEVALPKTERRASYPYTLPTAPAPKRTSEVRPIATNATMIQVMAQRLLAKPSVLKESERKPVEDQIRKLTADTFGGNPNDWTPEKALERVYAYHRGAQ